MAKTKKARGDLPIPEAVLDRTIGVIEGPVNRVVERVLKSRVVLFPMGLTFKLSTALLARVMGAPPHARPRAGARPGPGER
jgi:hypothetical protein